jgi:hypothetical protein
MWRKDMVILHVVHNLPGAEGYRCEGRGTTGRTAAALLLSSVIGVGCGGGGGGGSPALAPTVSPTYPPLTTFSNVSYEGESFQADSATGRITPTPSASQGSLTWTGQQLTGASLEVSLPAAGLAFTETFPNPGTRQLEIAPGHTVQLFEASKTASDGSQRSLLLLDPASAGLSYSTLGAWTYASSAAATDHFAARFHLGVRTLGRDIPTSGTGTFAGVMLGTFADGADVYNVSAAARAQADFAARQVAFSTDSSRKVLVGTPPTTPTVADSSLNLAGTLTYPSGSNALSGVLTAGDMSGPSSARFYGPAAVEIGGDYVVQNGGGSRQMTGSYVLRKQ